MHFCRVKRILFLKYLLLAFSKSHHFGWLRNRDNYSINFGLFHWRFSQQRNCVQGIHSPARYNWPSNRLPNIRGEAIWAWPSDSSRPKHSHLDLWWFGLVGDRNPCFNDYSNNPWLLLKSDIRRVSLQHTTFHKIESHCLWWWDFRVKTNPWICLSLVSDLITIGGTRNRLDSLVWYVRWWSEKCTLSGTNIHQAAGQGLWWGVGLKTVLHRCVRID